VCPLSPYPRVAVTPRSRSPASFQPDKGETGIPDRV